MARSPLQLAVEFAAELDRLEIPYVLGGSLASSLVGEPRSTVDIDLAVQIDSEQLSGLIAALADVYYVPTSSAFLAIEEHSSFNLVHLAEAAKFDLFVLGDDILDTNQMERRIWVSLGGEPDDGLWVTSPEDQILRKLSWYRMGGEVSDRQWRDIVAILRAQTSNLDDDYLATTATQVGIEDLLAHAQADAG